MAEQERKLQALSGSRLQFAEQVRNLWQVTVPVNTNPDDLLNPPFWAHVALRLRVKDRIEVWSEDGQWYTELLVVDRDRNWAKCHPLMGVIGLSKDVSEEQANAGFAEAQFEVMWRGPRKWSVVRKSDRNVVHEGEETKDGAENWLKHNAGALKKAA